MQMKLEMQNEKNQESKVNITRSLPQPVFPSKLKAPSKSDQPDSHPSLVP